MTHDLATTIVITTTTERQTLKVTDADYDQANRVVEAGSEASQFMQTLNSIGKTTTMYYKDPKFKILIML